MTRVGDVPGPPGRGFDHPERLTLLGFRQDSVVVGAARDAITALARSWVVELAARRVRVNTLSASPIETPNFDYYASADDRARLTAAIPLGRIGRPDEVAAAALFLAWEGAAS